MPYLHHEPLSQLLPWVYWTGRTWVTCLLCSCKGSWEKKVLASTIRKHRLIKSGSPSTQKEYSNTEEIQLGLTNFHYSGVQLNSLLTWKAFSKTTARLTVSFKYHMISLIGGIYNMAQMSLFTKQKQTHRHRELTCGCQGGGGREWDELGIWGW